MRAAFFTGLREMQLCEVPEPKLTRPDAVLLRIDRVGVCGSDVHYYTNGRIGDQLVEYPATVGHECAGTVVEVGAAVEQLAPGDRVAIDPAMSCGTCDQCRAGRPNTCRKLQFMGCPGESLGAVADYRVVPAQNCTRLPDAVTLDQAVLVEPLSVGLHAVRLGEVSAAARLAVLGAGPIGLSVLACAKATAAATVYVTDLIDERLQVARRLGADWTGNPGQGDVVPDILRREPSGLDLVFECSGDPACVDQATGLLAPGGRMVLVGIPATPRGDFDVHSMRRKELRLQHVRRQIDCVAPAIGLVADGQIDTDPLLTHRFPLEQIRDAFELVAGYRDGVIKAVIDLSSAD